MEPRKRRPRATQRIGISVDTATLRNLKMLAREHHGGSVSALISDMTRAGMRRAAFERAWRWYGGPLPDEEARAAIDAELEEGWELARKLAARPAQ
jgi:hypothetical protein